METIKQYATRLKSITAEQIYNDVRQIIERWKHVAIDLNTAQLMAGIDSRGERLFPEYNAAYAKYKGLLGLPSDRVTLYLEGDFHNSFFLDTSSWPLMFGATDPKTDKLMQNYGGEIFGLTEESLQEFFDFILDEEIEAYFKRLLLIQ